MIILEFTPSQKDFFKLHRDIYLRQWKSFIFLLLYILLSFFCSMSFLLQAIQNPAEYPLHSMASPLLFLMVGVGAVMIIVSNFLIRKKAAEKSGQFNRPVHVEITAEEILIKTQVEETRIGWERFKSAIETKDFFFPDQSQ